MITKEENIERLYDILKLDYDWNGYNAKPIPIEVIAKVKSLLEAFIIQPLMFPTGCESIQLEWVNKDYYFEIDIYKDKQMCYMLEDKVNDTILEVLDINDNIDEINKYLKKYFEGKGDMIGYYV